MNNYEGCLFCKHLDRSSNGMKCAAFPTKIPLPIVSGEVEHTQPMFGQTNKVVFKDVATNKNDSTGGKIPPLRHLKP